MSRVPFQSPLARTQAYQDNLRYAREFRSLPISTYEQFDQLHKNTYNVRFYDHVRTMSTAELVDMIAITTKASHHRMEDGDASHMLRILQYELEDRTKGRPITRSQRGVGDALAVSRILYDHKLWESLTPEEQDAFYDESIKKPPTGHPTDALSPYVGSTFAKGMDTVGNWARGGPAGVAPTYEERQQASSRAMERAYARAY